MKEITKVVVDAMGGDNAPHEIIKGAVEAVGKSNAIHVILVGKEDVINQELSGYTYNKEQISVVHTSEVIETAEPPVMAIRRKKDSSIVVGLKMVKDKEADAFVSAGSSGAVLAGGQLLVGRIKGVERPPLAPLIPTEKGFSILIDCGANVDARPSHLVQFAKMGSIYMEPMLKECKDINFIGSIEAREIPHGQADVIVCEAFTGNVILKLYEGVASVLVSKIKGGMKQNLRGMIGGLLVKPVLKKTMKDFDASEYGGAPLLGLTGLVVKTHGSSKAKEVCNSILQCVTFKEEGINEKIKECIQAEEKSAQE